MYEIILLILVQLEMANLVLMMRTLAYCLLSQCLVGLKLFVTQLLANYGTSFYKSTRVVSNNVVISRNHSDHKLDHYSIIDCGRLTLSYLDIFLRFASMSTISIFLPIDRGKVIYKVYTKSYLQSLHKKLFTKFMKKVIYKVYEKSYLQSL